MKLSRRGNFFRGIEDCLISMCTFFVEKILTGEETFVIAIEDWSLLGDFRVILMLAHLVVRVNRYFGGRLDIQDVVHACSS